MNTHRKQVLSRLTTLLLMASAPFAAISIAQTTMAPLELLSAGASGETGNGRSVNARISADGSLVAYWTAATNLPGATCGAGQIVLRNMITVTNQCIALPHPLVAKSDLVMTPDGAFLALTAGLVGDDTNIGVYQYEIASGVLRLASKSVNGGAAAGTAQTPCISASGRFVSFVSDGTDLVPGDANQQLDVFLYDSILDTVERISVPDLGGEGDSWSATGHLSKISDDGRFVAFYSQATNMVPGDTNGWQDVFLRDRLVGRTSRVSLGLNGAEISSWSPTAYLARNGRSIIFTSEGANLVQGMTITGRQVFRRNLSTGEITLLTKNDLGGPSNGTSVQFRVSPDETHVLLTSSATDLAGAQHAGGGVFVVDLASGAIRRVTLDHWDNAPYYLLQCSSISASARSVVLDSTLATLVPHDPPCQRD